MTQLFMDDRAIPVTPVRIIGELATNALKEGDEVNVRGMTKGHGFQGVVKRHSFGGGPATHGQKDRLRAPGSIGSTAPQRVAPGRKMAGHMGMVNVTIKNLRVVKIDNAGKTVFLRGAVPGTIGRELLISKQ